MNVTVTDRNLTLVEYQEFACRTDQFKIDAQALDQLRYGFFGEVGGLLSAVKKGHREISVSASRRSVAEEELGDALWYLAVLARRCNVSFDHVGEKAIEHLQQRLKLGDTEHKTTDIQFDQIDGLLGFRKQHLPPDSHNLLYDLAGQTSALFAQSRTETADLATPTDLELYGKLLELLAVVAASFELRLAEVAQRNLAKIASRWPGATPPYTPFFDDGLELFEQLPRELEINFIERKLKGRTLVIQQWHGVNIGDPLTDNRTIADHYRYHDVFHLAYVAHLGWSPVIRGLLKLKRKSQPDIDENEDGARAMIIEEGIATWIFNHARDVGHYFENVVEGKLEYGLLKQVKSMVSGYEVDACPLWQWERAILDGFKIFRQLREHKKGTVKVDMKAHTIEFRP